MSRITAPSWRLCKHLQLDEQDQRQDWQILIILEQRHTNKHKEDESAAHSFLVNHKQRSFIHIHIYTHMYMHVEEDHFPHKLIVALKQTNISHVSKRGEKESERDQDSP